MVRDWNDMERIWQYVYSKDQLQTFSEEVWQPGPPSGLQILSPVPSPCSVSFLVGLPSFLCMSLGPAAASLWGGGGIHRVTGCQVEFSGESWILGRITDGR